MNSAENKTGKYFHCDIESIRPNPYQPRTHFSQNETEELSQSIRQQGIIQPLLVRNSNGSYELVAGERRLRAAKMAGLDHVPVLLRDVSDSDMLLMSIIENIQRQNLNAMEEAEAYYRLMSEFHLSQEQVAKKVGKSRPAVTNMLRLRKLPQDIKNLIADGTLSTGHARALLVTETPRLMREACETVISKELSVRETENLIRRLKKQEAKPRKNASREVYFSDMAAELSRCLGTKVQIRHRGQKGKIEIEFYSNDDLDRLINLFSA